MPTISRSISTVNDDVQSTFGSTITNELDGEVIEVGVIPAGNPSLPQLPIPVYVGMRFQNIDVPQGATITDASLYLYFKDNTKNSTVCRVWAEDADDSAPYTAAAGTSPGFRTLTSASTTQAPDGGPGMYASSGPGVAALWGKVTAAVQEVINRPGWQSGNALSLVMRYWSDLLVLDPFVEFYAYSSSPLSGSNSPYKTGAGVEVPRLDITFGSDHVGEFHLIHGSNFV